MSLYASVADFKNRTTERAYSGMSDAFILAHLTDASELADAYLSQRGYEVPLTTVGNDLKGAICKIALYTAMTAYGYNPNSQAEEAVRMQYEDAMAFLRDVAKGVANLNTAITVAARTANGVAEVIRGDDEDCGRWE